MTGTDEQQEMKRNAAKEMYGALAFKPTSWGKDLAELLDFVAMRREVEAARDDCYECIAPYLREAAASIRAALAKARGEV